MVGLLIGLRISVGAITPPPVPGFVYIVENGFYIIDTDGSFLIEAE